MLGKKGADFGMGLTMIPSIIILIIILTFYFFLFIILGFGKSPDLIIKADSYSDSSKILVLVNVPIGESTLSESIINNIDDKEQLQHASNIIQDFILEQQVPNSISRVSGIQLLQVLLRYA